MNFKLLTFLVFLNIYTFGQTNEIIITEIYADPTPSKGLPEREFLELYNTSSSDISLKNFKLLYGNFSATFPDFVLKSKTYAIVCRKGYELEFAKYGLTIALSNFSLSNEGALLVLKNSNDKDVFYVEYSQGWHTLDNDGGVSLELIDTNFPCRGKENWASSKEQTGGTPGSANSVAKSNPDVLAPKLLNYSLNQNEIVLSFDDFLSEEFLKQANNFKIESGDLEILNVSYKPYKTNQILINLKSPLEIGEKARLIILNLEDCSGNVSDNLVIEFSNLVPAEKGEILLSEVLFNPKLGVEDFVEVYNVSEKTLSLKGWKLARLDSKNQVVDFKEIADYDLLIEPKQFMAFTLNKAALLQIYPKSGNVTEVQSLPALNNDFGTVFLFNAKDEEFDKFSYSEKMHNELIVNAEGISLERVSFATLNSGWTSASEDFGFATPGSKNSQLESDNLNNTFFAEPIVFNPYQNTSTFLKYNLNNQGLAATIVIIDKNGKPVRNLCNNSIIGTQGQIEWDGRNNSGELMPVGYYAFRIDIYSSKSSQRFLAKCVVGSN